MSTGPGHGTLHDAVVGIRGPARREAARNVLGGDVRHDVRRQGGRKLLVHSSANAGAAGLVGHAEHLALLVNPRHKIAAVVGHERPRPRPAAAAGHARSRRAARRCPAPVRAGHDDRVRLAPLQPGDDERVGRVGLVDDDQLGHLGRADLGEHPRTAAAGPRGRGASRRRRAGSGRRRPPPPASSGTPRPAGAADAGRSRRCRRGCRCGRRTSSVRRTVGSSVANSASSTSTPAPVSRLSSEDLPALV